MLFPAIKFSIHNIAFSSEKVILFESGEKYAQNNQNSRKYFQTNMSVDFDVRGQQGCLLSLEEVLLWIVDF